MTREELEAKLDEFNPRTGMTRRQEIRESGNGYGHLPKSEPMPSTILANESAERLVEEALEDLEREEIVRANWARARRETYVELGALPPEEEAEHRLELASQRAAACASIDASIAERKRRDAEVEAAFRLRCETDPDLRELVRLQREREELEARAGCIPFRRPVTATADDGACTDPKTCACVDCAVERRDAMVRAKYPEHVWSSHGTSRAP